MRITSELTQLLADIDEYGRVVQAKKERALEMLRGKIATRRGHRFRITSAHVHFSGSGGALVFFSGPVLKKDGTPHARHEESVPYMLFEALED